MPGPTINTSQVSLQLTGTTSVPNNFTVEIYQWDVATDLLSVTGRTYITGVTRTATSAVNGGSLTVSPYYGITGITGLDNEVKLTSTTSCSTTATQDITSAALTVYTPASGTLTEDWTSAEDIDSFGISGGNLSSGSHPLGQLTTLSYLVASGFTLSYVSGTTVSGGATVTGTYANGPFSSFSVTKSGKVFSLFGSANTSLALLNSPIHGIMRLTYNPSGYYVDFNYYYIPNSV
jgi:hypothetical protein